LKKWKEIGPLNLQQLVAERKVTIDIKNEIKYCLNKKYGGNILKSKYGQFNNQNKMEGFGRICFTDGEIQEGFFVNGSKNGFGRTIYPKGSYYIG